MSNIPDRSTAVLLLLIAFLSCLLSVVLPWVLQGAGLIAIVKHLLGS